MEEECILDMTDTEIAWNMRGRNFEKFKTLVRMHLSFELDLNTDEFDLPSHEVIYYEKGKMKKWNRLSRKIKSCTSSKSNASPSVGNTIVLDDNFIRHLQQLKIFILMDKNVVQEGIFRKTGSVTRQNELRAFVCNDKPFDLTSGYTVHDCATVFKSFLADLHEPVLTDAHYPAHCQIAPLCQAVYNDSTPDKNKEAHILNSIQLLLLLLPNENRILLQQIIEMLHIVSSFKDKNKMSSENLATLFAPHLICPRNLPPEALHYVAQTMFPIIAYMITKGSEIFEIPAKLSTDIRAYYHERKRKKTMSPEQTLDDSISDMSTVNTIYTFVDREKTAAAHNANNTDTELAQLYAHIQSLPESSKKRRLIKQFNKQNGQGTPLQLVIMNRLRSSETSKNAKSISDSIKKHIFHKGIISRTPKRSGRPLNAQTPIFSTKNPKLRVLFQSPILNSSLSHNSSATLANLSPSNMSTKMHALQKSLSSSSLVLKTSLSQSQDYIPSTTSSFKISSNEIESTCFSIPQYANNPENDEDLMPVVNRKTVAWKDQESHMSNPIHNNHADINIRYKSEPNLSQIFEKDTDESTINKTKPLIYKVLKGVSMGNLDVSFRSNHNKRLKYSSVLSKASYESTVNQGHESNSNDIFICTTENNFDEMSESFVDMDCGHHMSLRRNIDILTSTPSMLLGRRSMSPITKSTQRMPKAMQESIMTPRSRKPVMLANNMGPSEQTPKNNQSKSFREQDEEVLDCKKSSEKSDSMRGNILNSNQIDKENRSLSNGFREYLLSRSVLTASPEDSSFSSQPDDFGSTQDLDDLEESQLSSSLLYCLDGNHPNNEDDFIKTAGCCTEETSSISKSSSRKRIAVENCLKEGDSVKLDSFFLTKKLLFTKYNKNPGETSF